MQEPWQGTTDRDERLDRLENLVEQQQETIAALESRVGGTPVAEDTDGRVTRRRLLAGAGAAAAGAVAGTLAGAAPAGATVVTTGVADGDALQIGGNNTNTALSTIGTKLEGSTGPGAFRPMFSVIQTAQGNAAVYAQYAGLTQNYGVLGDAIAGDADSSGVTGRRTAGTLGVGVDGQAYTTGGAGVRARSVVGAGLQIVDDGVVMPPTTGNWLVGSFVVTGGHVWYCYVAGTGTASKWVRLSSSFVPLPAPARVFDSRGGPNAGGTPQGALTFTAPPPGAAFRDVNCAVPTGGGTAAPAGATAVLLNLAVVTLSGVGALNVYRHGSTQPNTANINWSAGGQVISNAVTASCDANRHVDIAIVAGAGASTHFIVDVVGYYL